MKMCDINEEGKVVDPITDTEIPEEFLVTFVQNNQQFCFDVRTLAQYVKTSGRFENPFTRLPLPSGPPQPVKEQVEEYIQSQQVRVTYDIFGYKGEITFDKTDTVGRMLIDIYNAAGYPYRLGYDTFTVDPEARNRPYTITIHTLTDMIGTLSEDRNTMHIQADLARFNIRQRYEAVLEFARQQGLDWLRERMELLLALHSESPSTALDYDVLENFVSRTASIRDITVFDISIARLSQGARLRVSDIERLLEFPQLVRRANLDPLYKTAIDPYNFHRTSPYFREPSQIPRSIASRVEPPRNVVRDQPRLARTTFDPNLPAESYTVQELRDIMRRYSETDRAIIQANLQNLNRQFAINQGYRDFNAMMLTAPSPYTNIVARSHLYQSLREFETSRNPPPPVVQLPPPRPFFDPNRPAESYTLQELRNIIDEYNESDKRSIITIFFGLRSLFARAQGYPLFTVMMRRNPSLYTEVIERNQLYQAIREFEQSRNPQRVPTQ